MSGVSAPSSSSVEEPGFIEPSTKSRAEKHGRQGQRAAASMMVEALKHVCCLCNINIHGQQGGKDDMHHTLQALTDRSCSRQMVVGKYGTLTYCSSDTVCRPKESMGMPGVSRDGSATVQRLSVLLPRP